MPLGSIKAIAMAVWVSAVGIAGVVGHVQSPASWTILAGVAALPMLIMMWLWRTPDPTISESIQQALRSRRRHPPETR